MTPSPSVARHRAPDSTEIRIATPQDVVRTGRHAEPEGAREVPDPRRDGDLPEWPGFRAVG